MSASNQARTFLTMRRLWCSLAPLAGGLVLTCGGKQSFSSDRAVDATADAPRTDGGSNVSPIDDSATEPSAPPVSPETGAAIATGETSADSDGVAEGTTEAPAIDVTLDEVGPDASNHGTDTTADAGHGTGPTEDATMDTSTNEVTCARPREQYVALGDDCHLIDLNCENVFVDDCGCGCVSPDVEPMEQPCPLPPGMLLDIQNSHVQKVQCGFSFSGVPSITVRTEDDYRQFVERVLPHCGNPVENSEIDFSNTMLLIATVAERPDAEFSYAVLTDEGIVVGLHAPAYCGGAAPPSSLFLIELPRSETDVRHDVCYTGDCGDGPPPP